MNHDEKLQETEQELIELTLEDTEVDALLEDWPDLEGGETDSEQLELSNNLEANPSKWSQWWKNTKEALPSRRSGRNSPQFQFQHQYPGQMKEMLQQLCAGMAR